MIGDILVKLANKEELTSSEINELRALNFIDVGTPRTQDLSQISPDMGDISAGRFLALSSGLDPTASDATGAFMSANGEVFGSDTYNIGGVNSGVLEFGLSSTTGKALAGGGQVVLDENGITLAMQTGTYSEKAAVKFSNGTDTPVTLIGKYQNQLGTIDTVAAIMEANATTTEPNSLFQLSANNHDLSAAAILSLSAGSTAGTSVAGIDADSVLVNGSNILKSGDFTGILVANGNLATVAAGATSYFGFGSVGIVAVNTAYVYTPYATKLRNMFIGLRTNQPATGSLVISLIGSDSVTYATYTFPAGGAGGAWRSVPVSVDTIPSGVLIAIKVVNNASTASSQIASITMGYGNGQ